MTSLTLRKYSISRATYVVEERQDKLIDFYRLRDTGNDSCRIDEDTEQYPIGYRGIASEDNGA